MLDIQFIRDNRDLVAEKSRQKGYDVDIPQLLELDGERRSKQTQIDELRQRRNSLAAEFKNQKPSPEQLEQGRQLKEELGQREEELAHVEDKYLALLKKVPNMPLADVPVGASEDENVVAKTVGEPTQFDFAPKSHADIAEAKGWLDKERAAKVTGSRFAYIKGDLVRLQFAIVQFVITKLTDPNFIDEVIVENGLTNVSNKPFVPVLPPLMLRESLYDAMDRLEPRDDRYKLEGDDDLWLQGSAEHVLGSMHADEILAESDLPLRYLGYATSFRREAGTYGKDMEGMFRMHQFDKLEMESLTLPENGLQEHFLLVGIQEKLMQLLGIPYHVLTKCTADIGKPNARGVDIEAWLPHQAKYRETHTADYMTDYQARRLKTRVKRADGSVELVHTNDATAFALSRTPIAIIENFQTPEGNVRVPEVLQPFLNGQSEL
ncbi:MAG TPA: serine--tRNA ligase [Candidatus Saccharimonadales bacterium]|nr:serine--tRNA ligase [Candidatus Saccharimonadales bacterium]